MIPDNQEPYRKVIRKKRKKKEDTNYFGIIGTVLGCLVILGSLILGVGALKKQGRLPWQKDDDTADSALTSDLSVTAPDTSSAPGIEPEEPGSEKEVTEIVMPDLVGMTMCDAVTLLNEYGVYTTAVFQQVEDKSKRMCVLSQDVKAGEKIMTDQTVELSFGTDLAKDSKGYNSAGKAASYTVYNARDYNITTWGEAKNFCEKQGGHLAVINSYQENAFVYYVMLRNGVYSAFIGYSDYEREGEWKWYGDTGGEEFWNCNEPDGEQEHSDYAMYYPTYRDGTWNDGDFEGEDVYFICETVYEEE